MSDILKNPAIVGGGGAVVGMLVGVMVGNATVDTRASEAVQRAMQPASEAAQAQTGAMEALSARIDAMESQMAETASATQEQIASSVTATQDLASAMADKLTALQDDLGDQVADAASAQTSALENAVAGLSQNIATSVSSVATQITASVSGRASQKRSSSEPEAQRIALPEGLAASAQSFGVGQTATFADGMVRAFVTRIDSDGAVLNVQRAPMQIAEGEAVSVAYNGNSCTLGVAGVSEAGVAIASDCGSEAASAESAATEAPAPEAPAAAASLFAVGQTAMFADGGVRAFISRVGDDSAVLNVQREMHTLTVGETVSVDFDGGTCGVGLAAITAEGVEITSDCGTGGTPAAAAETAADASDTGATGLPGETLILSDGALRVFVSGVINGDARLAVNGLTTQMVAAGGDLAVTTAEGDCTISVAEIDGSAVTLSGSCG